ncbi:Cut9-interacting protein scn1 [Conoideocrella luteorostrata]|uniref:Cut9-interacting protein scn1 n=1 Tax=Conoideocrella luteorostrata TaxID=1105319 RepID=A0AAJ0CG25_9HYPO|nr:Cut9-interacting protein scn1 [Conoideocrella luteorostrata]
MGSVASLKTMRASALAIMATRSQDQDLVADVASLHGVDGPASWRGNRGHGYRHDLQTCQAMPSFGWHPWFSYQMYDDVVPEPTYKAPPGSESSTAFLLDAKKAHYQVVLAPSPQDDQFIASLPTPIPLSSFISSTRSKLSSYPYALVGEIGLDRAFRLPENWDSALAAARDDGLTPGGREGRRLSPHRVQMQHQQAVLRAQLRLAGEVGRPVSLHGVDAHGILYDTVSSCWKGHERHILSRRERRNIAPGAEEDDESDDGNENSTGGKPYPPRICLHSYSGPVESLSQWLRPAIPAKIYFSFSTAVNLSRETTRAKFIQVVSALPEDKILVESDLHVAGEEMDAALEDMYRRVCHIKGWGLEEGVRKIGNNFENFVFGETRAAHVVH